MDIKTKLYVAKEIFSSNLFAIRDSKIILKLHKPTYIRMCILDLMKKLMHEFHYDYIKNKFGNNPRLFFPDPDRLIHKIKTKDVFEDFI